jgi:hypothetical protein
MLVVVLIKTRTRQRDGRGATVTVMAEIENSLQHQTTSYRSEAVTSRDQLNEGRVQRLAG